MWTLLRNLGRGTPIDAFRLHLDGPTDLRLEGELDLFAAEELAKVLLPMCDAPGASVSIDLADVSFIDSTGIALLLRAHRRTEGAGGRLQVIEPVGQVARVLVATGAEEILEIVPAGRTEA